MRTTLKPLALLVALAAVSGCSKEQATNDGQALKAQEPQASEQQALNIDIWPTLDFEVKQDAEVEASVKSLLSTMTLEQKVAQMIQPEIRDITVEDMRKYGFGSYLNGGGSFPNNNKQSTPQDWINLAEAMYQASIDDSLDGSTIPTMWGTDAVHGHNNVIGATLFPHNIGLGAMNNPELIEKIAEITAKEVMVTGIDWVFAPTVAVARDDRWGRTYESYSEDPAIVKAYSKAIVKGLQGHADGDFLSDKRVISTVKHFLGDGGTEKGDDQGDNIASEQALFDIHAQGYVGGLTAGSQSVMASFNSWHGEKIHGKKYLLTDVLKDKMGFDGFVVGDWNGHGQIQGCTNDNCPQAVNAGLDMYMVPTSAWKPLYENTIAQVKSGIISQARIDDAVSRILRVKIRAGLFEKPSPANRQYSGKTELIGAQAHRDIARQAVRESLVLLKNKDNLLPLAPKQHVLVAGNGADNIGKQSGGWTVTWQGTGNNNNDFPGGTSIYDGIAQKVTAAGGKVTLNVEGEYQEKPDVAIVVFGEDPYAEGHGDRDNLDYQRGEKTDLALLTKLKAQGIPVVSVFISGRPMWVNAELNASTAFVAAWLPGSEGVGVSDVLFTEANGDVAYDFTGKLSFSWPNSANQAVLNKGDDDYQPLLPYGFGLKYGDENVLADNLNAELAIDEAALQKRVFFDGKMHKPWLMWLFSADQQLQPNANTHSLAGLTYRTVDRLVQEDSIQLTFNGTEKAGIRLVSKSNFREDLRSAIEQNGKLSFMVNVLEKPTAPVIVSMACQKAESPDDNCGAAIDVTENLSGRLHHGWSQASIDLACFANKGMSFGDLVAPFELTTTGKATIQIGSVMFEPQPKSAESITCQ
ncbi:glycoside hydrolase family 3 C-terminal domain-containing protein [Thalassotalea sp. LPB0316]|uniref:glycoside hydrolase family 3 protein n=1 Tax=Thalassotalea sp. LPB0316 TaxID=2769490 RepID=UPI0018686F73|nr:exo 1,3/1,4-beta-D-glucan glucohydrolase [Thalassotalea sp. LPB0316]QOL24558.1 glycoside hydrolase family 3 C-terminal domain-containing protein [Thalassotalea sp. LPB0316]